MQILEEAKDWLQEKAKEEYKNLKNNKKKYQNYSEKILGIKKNIFPGDVNTEENILCKISESVYLLDNLEFLCDKEIISKTAKQFDSALYPYKELDELFAESYNFTNENKFLKWIRRRRLSPEERRKGI